MRDAWFKLPPAIRRTCYVCEVAIIGVPVLLALGSPVAAVFSLGVASLAFLVLCFLTTKEVQ